MLTLATDAFEPEIGVLHSEIAGPLESGVGQPVQRESEELGIDSARDRIAVDPI
jgi:hypothetical protein